MATHRRFLKASNKNNSFLRMSGRLPVSWSLSALRVQPIQIWGMYGFSITNRSHGIVQIAYIWVLGPLQHDSGSAQLCRDFKRRSAPAQSFPNFPASPKGAGFEAMGLGSLTSVHSGKLTWKKSPLYSKYTVCVKGLLFRFQFSFLERKHSVESSHSLGHMKLDVSYGNRS